MTIYRDDLERVYALIEDPKRWAQGYYALDADGAPICDEDGDEIEDQSVAVDERAACWCIWGAAYKCGIRSQFDGQFVEALGFQTVFEPNDFNDQHTHAEVLALLRSAIERAPARPVRP